MAGLDAGPVAALLVELGRRTALTGDNYFRAKAYRRAADALAVLVELLDRVIAENRLRQLPCDRRLDEIERAAAHNIPPLVTAADLLGILHAHSTASDGVDTLEAMSRAPRPRLPIHGHYRSLEEGALRRWPQR